MALLRCGDNQYEACIDGKTESYYCYIQLPNSPKFDGATLFTSWNLRNLIKGIDVTKFKTIIELMEYIEEGVRAHDLKERRLTHKFYEAVYQEMNRIGPEAIIDNSFSLVEISHSDCAGRNHTIKISLPEEYPFKAVLIQNHELPIDGYQAIGDQPNFSNLMSIYELYIQFKKLIELFQPFWESMDVFDNNCWVVEPLHPRLSDTIRRIKVSESCTALLKFNPYNSCHCPTIEFRGSSDDVNKFRNRLATNLLDNLWDPEVDIHMNLLSVLDLDYLPSKDLNEEDSGTELGLLQPGECGICFEERLDGHGADSRCENDKCNSQYHQVCLLKYLSTDMSNIRIKNAIMGKCPTCRETIGCSTVSISYNC